MLKRRPSKKNAAKPSSFDVRAWFAEMDRYGTEPFPERGREQPKTPRRKIFDR
jgi:hypothetical protein